MSAADKATAAQRESGRPAAASPDGKSLVAQGDTSRQGGGSSSVTQSPAAPDTGQAAAPAADPAAVATTSTTDKPAATQDGSGRWIIAFPNGNTLEMQSYVERQGSVPAAIQYVQGLIAQETDPERLDYRRQQLFALTQMSLSRRR